VSRRSRSVGRGRAPATLPPWPLDPPTVTTAATLPTATHDATPKPATAGHYCRRCRSTGDGPVPPPGWLRLQRRSAGQSDSWRWQTIGVYCGVECLTLDTEGSAKGSA
jgi:hypothetical protein